MKKIKLAGGMILNGVVSLIVTAMAFATIAASILYSILISLNFLAFSLFGDVLLEKGAKTIPGVITQIITLAIVAYLSQLVITLVNEKPKKDNPVHDSDDGGSE